MSGEKLSMSKVDLKEEFRRRRPSCNIKTIGWDDSGKTSVSNPSSFVCESVYDQVDVVRVDDACGTYCGISANNK